MTQDQINQLLNAIAEATQIASGLGVPVVGTISSLIPIFEELVESIRARTGKTREEIIAETSKGFSEEIVALLASEAAGE